MANIRTARRSGLVLRGGVNRRETMWSRTTFVRTTVTAPDTAVVQFSFATVITDLEPFTIVRTRGFIHLSSDQTANSESQEIAFGIAVISQQASAIGVTAVPTPVNDSSSDLFFVYETMTNQMLLSSAVGIIAPAGVGRTFDSKAQRKMEDGTNLNAVIESGPNGTGQIFTSQVSFLLKLH